MRLCTWRNGATCIRTSKPRSGQPHHFDHHDATTVQSASPHISGTRQHRHCERGSVRSPQVDMLFAEEDEGHLKSWIVRRLANTSDADSDVLADYVLALLRHDGDQATIRKLFESEIPDFLSEDSIAFTNDVFQALNYKSYLPGARPAPPAPRPSVGAPTAAPFIPLAQQQNAASPNHSAPSKKRRASDRDDDDVEIVLDNHRGRNGALPKKQQKRDQDPQSNAANFYSHRQQGGMPQFFQGAPAGSFDGSIQGFPQIDPNIILQNIQMLQQLGIPLPDPTGFAAPSLQKSRKKKRRCRDYDKKGFCARGGKCKFEHGSESVFLPSFMPPTGDVALEYDPAMAMGRMFPPQRNLPSEHRSWEGQPHDEAPQSNGREPKKSKKQKGKQLVAVVNGPVHDRSRTKIVVQNIPKENLSEDQIRDFFSQFGTVTDIAIQEHGRLAVLNFETWDAAHAAWSSPKVIFDNRFVKVFWQKDESDSVQGKSMTDTPDEPDFDMDEFIQKQAEAQRVHEEKTKRRQEIERERQDLEERRTRHLMEKRDLDAKLRSASPAGHAEGKSSGQTEALRAQLAALEAEADLLGLDPDAAQDESFTWNGRGGRVGVVIAAGAGSHPGLARRLCAVARGRGVALGGVEARHAAYAQYSLDLRPKVVIVSGADFTVPGNDECLRQYLFNVGEFESIHADTDSTKVTFKDRKTAEHFMSGLASSGNTLAGMNDKLELTWGQHSTPAAVGATKAAATKRPAAAVRKPDGDDAVSVAGSAESGEIQEDEDGQENVDGGEFGGGLHGRDHGDMDYEGGDDWIS
ncbi:RNA-binding protein 26 [Microdochium nivale]|nr:RNA-binding protein 26 [Microdochium nivale]